MNTQDGESTAPLEFHFLVEKASQLGAKEVKVIPASQIVIENRVTLKCRSGCVTYGQKLTCPPYVPTPDQFREIVREYRSALLVKFSSDANVDPDIILLPVFCIPEIS